VKLKSAQSGQAIIEYILLLSIIITVSGLILGSVRSSRDKLWKMMICQVSAACPTCKATDSARTALPNTGGACKY
jgi:hypothetical protein